MLFSRKDLVRIIVPLIIEQVLAVFIGMVDSMMVSSVGEAAVSGVSLVDSLNLLLVYVFAALATGGSVVASQFLGAKDYKLAQNAAKQLLYTTTAVALVIMSIAVCFRSGILRLVFGSIEADVMGHAKIYFLFTALSYPFLAIYNTGAALFRSMGNSKISMRASLMMNLINVCGNAILIFGFHMGAAGAGLATLFSRVVGALFMMILIHNKENTIFIEKIFHYKPNFSIIKRILRNGIPLSLENGMFQFGKLLTQSLISTFGTISIAANAVSSSLTSLEYVPGTAVGLSMIPIVGRCIGAKDKEQTKHYAKILYKTAYIVVITAALIITVLGKPLIGMYNLSEASSNIAFMLILYHGICVSIIWPTAFPLANVFRAASDVKYPMVISITSMWIFRVGLSYVLGGYLGLGVFGVWIAMTSDWLFRGILFFIHYKRGNWLNHYKS